MIPNDRRCILLEVVRGQKPWSVLPKYGFKVSHYENRWKFGVDPGPPLQVSLSNISEGLLELLPRPDDLREWASFIVAASSLVDLEDVEDCDLLLEPLWEASFGEQVRQSALRLASRLKDEGCEEGKG